LFAELTSSQILQLEQIKGKFENKLNEVDLMGREWFLDRLSAMETSRKGWRC
jgi:hypothetical protein